MPATELKELLKHELGDILYAEQKILRMLGAMNRESSNPKMKERLDEHLTETYEQIERLKRAFEVIGEEAKAEKCHAAIGLKEEHDSFVREEQPSPPMLEAFDLGNGLRVEHYEIAGYRSAIALAQAMGENECVALLSESLREEEAMATFIERSAARSLKLISATMEAGDDEAPKRGRSSGARTGGKTASRSGGKGKGKAANTGAKTAGKSAAGKSGAAKTAGKSASGKGGAAKSAGKTASRSASGGAKSGSARKTAAKSGGRAKA